MAAIDLLPDGDYYITLHHTWTEHFEFLGVPITAEKTDPLPYFSTLGRMKIKVQNKALTIDGKPYDLDNNPVMRMEFFFRARLLQNNDVALWHKLGAANAPGFGPN